MMQEETLSRAEQIMQRAVRAAAVFTQLDQKQTDRIVRAVYKAGFDQRIRLAKMAAEETEIGKWKDKVIKNVIATQLVYEDIKDLKTVGIISEDHVRGIVEIAQPLGPLFAIVPVTNPTSTVLFKCLIAMKTRNPIIIHSPGFVQNCVQETARVCYEAALSEDAPEDCIQCTGRMSREQTQELMRHKNLALIIATGGGAFVKAAYLSGTPTIGVGSGNVPAFIEPTADIPFAVEQVFLSKTFDNGTVCASEQAVVVERSIAGQVIEQFKHRKAYFLSQEEVGLLGPIAFDQENGVMRVTVIGRPATAIAYKAGISVPPDTTLLIAPISGVGDVYPLSSEILAPILAFYVVDGFDDAVKLCLDLNYHGGLGHTVSIFSNDESKIKQFATLMNAGRIIVNTPSSQGALGGIYNTLHPSFTLSCGSGGKNTTTDNITAMHLVNIQRIARRRMNERFTHLDQNIYLDETIDAELLQKIYGRNY